jgi:hypothetical protein
MTWGEVRLYGISDPRAHHNRQSSLSGPAKDRRCRPRTETLSFSLRCGDEQAFGVSEMKLNATRRPIGPAACRRIDPWAMCRFVPDTVIAPRVAPH